MAGSLVPPPYDCCVELGGRGQVLYADPALQHWLSGGLPKRLSPRHIHAEDRSSLRRALRSLKAGAHHPPVMVRLQDGRRLQAHLRLLPGPDGDPRLLAICREAHLTMDPLEVLQRQPQLDDHTLRVGGIAHDLNNLLGSLLGNLQLGRLRLAQGQSAEKHLDRVERSAERAVELCRRLRMLGQPVAEVRGTLDFHALLQESLALMEACLPPGVTLQIDLADGTCLLQGHRSELQQAVMNLILNAAESHQGRPGRVRIRTAAALWDGRPHIVLEVQDDGCGMTEEVRARILEPWFSTKGAGRGLGLNAMAAMLRNHGGALDIQSAPGQGSTFRLSLPLDTEGMEKL